MSKIITKWAPPSENNTKNYIEFVSKTMGVSADTVLSYELNTFSSLVNAMSIMELGKDFAVSHSQIKEVINEFKLF